jgi:NADP-dependent 3-hydroxy acid dehydrogenase YdfG
MSDATAVAAGSADTLIFITGATGGLGEALARTVPYAVPAS